MKKENDIEREKLPKEICWNCKENPKYKPKCPFCKEVSK